MNVIAIDGHSSTGKSTFARIIAKKLGYVYIDSGAMYRAFALFAYRKGLIAEDGSPDISAINAFLLRETAPDEAGIRFLPTGEDGASETYLNGENVEQEIRTMKISSFVSRTAAIPSVRKFIDTMIHRIDGVEGMVMDGRDIGTAVFPDAALKIFMTADAETRAGRRFAELAAKGEKPDFDEVLRNVRERDYLDEHRETAPLVRAEDAVLLDNSDMSVEEQTAWVMKLLEKRALL